MTLAVEPTDHTGESLPSIEGQSGNRGIVLQELDKILESRFFKNAGRSRQFLQYVVQNKLDGQSEHLKERTIGTNVFHRPPTYATGDDPVVRVQAGEVRRRLGQYYQEATVKPLVRIELPVGSYSPQFHWPANDQATRPATIDRPQTQALARRRPFVLWVIAIACAMLGLGAGILIMNRFSSAQQGSALEQFWAPVFSTQQPVLICLAKGVTYRPGLSLYERYWRTHPGKFRTEVERSNDPLPLDGNEKLQWSDLNYYEGWGVALGDVDAAVKLSAVFGQLHKPSQVRIGEGYSFEDLRNSPAVTVGAFNNKWTLHLTSGLHFAFVEEHGQTMIREQTPGGRTWTTHHSDLDPARIPTIDYAIVARLLDSNSGQFTIAVAGLEDSGTRAAGEFVTNPAYIKSALQSLPADWQKKNMEFVLQTTITDSTPGPPQVIAAHLW